MIAGRAGGWILVTILVIIALFIPVSNAISWRVDEDSGYMRFPDYVEPVPLVEAEEIEARFDLERFPGSFDPPWKIEDTIGDSREDDESPALALNANGTFLAMWQIKNGSRYDIGYLLSMKGGAWGGGIIKNATFDARNISIAAFDDGRFMAIAEDWSNRTRLVRFVTSDEGNSWSIFLMKMESGAGGYKYVKVSNPSICGATNKTPGDTLFGSFDVVTNASNIPTIGILYSPAGGRTGISYSHFSPQSSAVQKPRSSVSKSKITGFMRGYITAELTNGSNTDVVLLHNNLPSQGSWSAKQYSPDTASWEADPNIPSDGSTVLWVMRSGTQTDGNIIAMGSTDDGKTFGSAVNVVSTAGVNEQFPSASIHGNYAWVGYADGNTPGNWKSVNSTDGGKTWGTPVRVATTTNTLDVYLRTGMIVFTGGPPGTLWTDLRQKDTQKRNVYFSSAPDRYPPGVVWTDPSNGATNVSTFIKPQILFSEAMDTGATEGAITFNPGINYKVEWLSSGLMKVVPSSPLKSNTKYTVTIGTGAKDYYGNTMTSSYTFEFTTGIGDNKPPEISFLRPRDNENVSGIVEINATASDNIAVAKVSFYIDTQEIVNFTHPPFMIKWDSTKVPDGRHNLSGVAWDTSGNSNTTKIVINVTNRDHTPPEVKIVSPVNGSAVSKKVTIIVNATDNSGSIKYVSIQVDAVEIANLTSPPYRELWDSTTVSDGAHKITAIASDLMGNIGSDTIEIIVANNDTTPPVVSFVHPAAGGELSGVVTIEINASDNLGIARVELRIDSSLVKTFTSKPYVYDWTTTSVQNGNHTLNATAYDGADNRGYTEITVKVKNLGTAPVINHTGVESAVEGSDITIIARITDDVGVKMASINITYGGGDIASISMKPTGNASNYSGVIPGSLVKPPEIYYYIYAEDTEGKRSMTQHYRVTVKRSSFLSMELLFLILGIVIAVVVVSAAGVAIRRRKKKRQQASGLPFVVAAGESSEEKIRGPIPDFGIGEGPEEGVSPPGQPPQPGFVQAPEYPPPAYPQPGGPPAEPMPPQPGFVQAPEYPPPAYPQPGGPPAQPFSGSPLSPPVAKEEEWGFPSGSETPKPVPSTIECPLCGGTNPPGSKWCANCGGKLV
jgi:hypothetical protein